MSKLSNLIPADFSGSVLVTVDEKVAFKGAYGFADRPNHVPNQMDTKYATASAGKFFVAIGIMQLIEAGTLNLSDAIESILDIPLNQIDPSITVQQLLCHISGVPDYFDESVMTDYADLWVNFPCYRVRRSKDLLPLFINKPMLYPAGSKFQYNNTGYVILDLIIEKMTGMPFDDYLQTVLFRPCDMQNTGYYEMDRLPAKCAQAYIFDEKKACYYTNIFSVDTKGTGAGGAFTTVEDISKLWSCLLKGDLINKTSLDQMFSLQASFGDDYYGYGVWLKKIDNRCIPFFQGYDPGVSFISSYDLQNKINITITSNMCHDVWAMESDLYKALI